MMVFIDHKKWWKVYKLNWSTPLIILFWNRTRQMFSFRVKCISNLTLWWYALKKLNINVTRAGGWRLTGGRIVIQYCNRGDQSIRAGVGRAQRMKSPWRKSKMPSTRPGTLKINKFGGFTKLIFHVFLIAMKFISKLWEIFFMENYHFPILISTNIF